MTKRPYQAPTAPRKRAKENKPTSQSPSKNKSTTGTWERTSCHFDDPVLGEVDLKFDIRAGQIWEAFEERCDEVNKFHWMYWPGGSRGMVYVVDGRGDELLVVFFHSATDYKETGFVNEVVPDMTTKGVHVVNVDRIGSPILVESWINLHRHRNSVGDCYFYRSFGDKREECKHPKCSRKLSSNETYLVCDCNQAYHGRCLADLPLLHQENHTIVAMDGAAPRCPGCNSSFSWRPAPSDISLQPQLTIIADIGTYRVKLLGIHEETQKEHAVVDTAAITKPICTIDTDGAIYFDERAPKEGLVVIEPFKKLITGDKSALKLAEKAKASPQELMKSFCQEVLKSVQEELRKFIRSLDDLQKLRVRLAIACPAGLSPQSQNVLLNAMLLCSTNVTPVLFNEAEMAYMGGLNEQELSEGTKVLSVDVGGYTADMMLGEIDTLAKCKPISLRSVYCGDEWALSKIIEYILKSLVGSTEADVKVHVRQFDRDMRDGRNPKPMYKDIDFGRRWEEIKQQQLQKAVDGLESLLKDESDIGSVIWSGGGIRRKGLCDALEKVAEPKLHGQGTMKEAERPHSESSTVIEGMCEAMKKTGRGANSLTVLSEHEKKPRQFEYTVLQLKNEAVCNPVLPASRASSTIIYEVQPHGDLSSTMQLLGTSDDLGTTVTDDHFQIAKLRVRQKEQMIKDQTMWILGTVEIDFYLDQNEVLPDYLIQVTDVQVHQGYKTVCVEALLLGQRAEDTEADRPEPDYWRTWGFTESISMGRIREMADGSSRFRLVSEMKPRMFSLDVNNTAARTQFVH